MITEVRFKTNYRDKNPVFKKNQKIKFRPGVNLVVGDQGAGKSSLLYLIADMTKSRKWWNKFDLEKAEKVVDIKATPCRVVHHDFEKDNPRVAPAVENAVQLNSLFQSHGEAGWVLMDAIAESYDELRSSSSETVPFVFVFDEPDAAMSIRSCAKLTRMIKKLADDGHQVIASVHSETVISQFDEVLSLEHGRKWIKSSRYITLHKEED